MQMISDLFPALVFFIVYKIWGTYWGVFALIVASAIQIAYMQIHHGQVKRIYWISFILIVVFGGLTIYLHNPLFLKWSVTIINWLFGVALLASHFFPKTIFEAMIHSSMPEGSTPPPTKLIRTMNGQWGGFFLFIGTLNLYIAYHYSMNTWVNFKVFGILGLFAIFVILQLLYLAYLHRSRK